MRARNLLGLSVIVASLVACATGGKFGGGGSGGDGSGAAGGGSGGQTGTTTTTPVGGTGGGMTTTTTTTTTQACAEAPCKLVSPQCGCGAGDMCAIDDTGTRSCHVEGDTQLQQPCAGLYSCVAGSLCVQTSTSTSLCTSYCDADNQCSGGLCLIQLNDPSNPGGILQDVTLCTDDCNPITSVGCPAGLGLGCGVYQEQAGQMRIFTLCGGAGNGGQGTACTTNEDCLAGSACFTLNGDPNDQQCLKYCNLASPSCPGVTTCVDIMIAYNGVNYGACL